MTAPSSPSWRRPSRLSRSLPRMPRRSPASPGISATATPRSRSQATGCGYGATMCSKTCSQAWVRDLPRSMRRSSPSAAPMSIGMRTAATSMSRDLRPPLGLHLPLEGESRTAAGGPGWGDPVSPQAQADRYLPRAAARFSPPPCGEGSGVGIARCGTTSTTLHDPPPQPSPARGEGDDAARASPKLERREDSARPSPKFELRENGSSLYRLMTFMSPGYPVGAFAYSSGTEWAVEAGDIRDAATLQDWLAAMIR